MKVVLLIFLAIIYIAYSAAQESVNESLMSSWDQIRYYSLNILAGIPEVAIFQIANLFCSVGTSLGIVQSPIMPNMSTISIQLRTACKNISYSLDKIEDLFNDPDFDMNKRILLFADGWLTDVETFKSFDTEKLAKAYNCRGDYNFLSLDAAKYIGELYYPWSAVNTEEIGRLIALSLTTVSSKISVENIHFIGFSLGAHIVGSIGHHYRQYSNKTIKRITALDPANPCFNRGQRLLMGLQRDDANFVDIIHSNPGVFGKASSLGDVDFYAGGLAPIKPGCFSLACSHLRAVDYYMETVYPGNETDFLSTPCTSSFLWETGYCNGIQHPMGIAVPVNIKGNYYLTVNAELPYGKNTNGNGTPANSKCGLCPN